MNVELQLVKAYCVNQERDAKYPEQNFKAVVPKAMVENVPDVLVLQTGSIEITNINVNKAMVDSKKDIVKYKQEWFDKVQKSSEDLFEIAEDATKDNPNMKVIIIKRLPRFDKGSADLMNIKAKLSEYGNSAYEQIWLRRGSPANISIVDLALDCSGPKRNYLREIIYGNPNSSSFDGLHLRGEFSHRHFTYRAVTAIKPILGNNERFSPAGPRENFTHRPTYDRKKDYHNSCPQTIYQQGQSATNHRRGNIRGNQSKQQSYSDVVKSKNDQKSQQSGHKQGYIYDYAVPTSNYFDHLN